MPSYKTEAINLRSSPFGEADKLVTLFSKEYGKIRAIAKGARRPKSKFGGRMEILAHNHYFLASGRDLDIVSQCETIDSFYKLREDPEKLACSVYFVKLVDGSTSIGQQNREVFKLLLDCLKLLENKISAEVLARIFEVKLIDVEGFFPVIDKCVKCGRIPKTAPEKVKFNHTLKGITCTKCSREVGGGIEVPYDLVLLMSKIKETPLDELIDLRIKDSMDKMIHTLASSCISDHIERDVASWKQ